MPNDSPFAAFSPPKPLALRGLWGTSLYMSLSQINDLLNDSCVWFASLRRSFSKMAGLDVLIRSAVEGTNTGEDCAKAYARPGFPCVQNPVLCQEGVSGLSRKPALAKPVGALVRDYPKITIDIYYGRFALKSRNGCGKLEKTSGYHAQVCVDSSEN